MLQETLCFGYTIFGSYVQSKIIKSNRLCRQGCTCELMLLHQYLPDMDYPISLLGGERERERASIQSRLQHGKSGRPSTQEEAL